MSSSPLNFVIGGIPRSGTTILSKTMNLHHEVYSYSSETNVFRYAWEYARARPWPKHQLDGLRRRLHADMNVAMVEHFKPYRESLKLYQSVLLAYNPLVSSEPILPIFSKKDVLHLHEELMAEFEKGLFGPQLVASFNSIIGKWIRLRSGRDIVGEKTPDNIFAMPWIAETSPKTRLMFTLRDPVYTVNSMIERGKGRGAQDKIFSTDFAKSVGYYERYLLALTESLRAGVKPEIVTYEAFVENPGLTLHMMLFGLGRKAEMNLRKGAVALVGQGPKRSDQRAELDPFLLRLTSLILQKSLMTLGVDYQLEMDSLPDSDQVLEQPMIVRGGDAQGSEGNSSRFATASSGTVILPMPSDRQKYQFRFSVNKTYKSVVQENQLNANLPVKISLETPGQNEDQFFEVEIDDSGDAYFVIDAGSSDSLPFTSKSRASVIRIEMPHKYFFNDEHRVADLEITSI
ncbi:MAG: sulfotransferase [Pseudomonadota bacterium]